MTQEKMSINNHIETYLNYYLSLSQAHRFAILLKGEWGCGKTWFIKRYREKLKEKNQKCLYVSLYGMTSFSEIEEAFFQQLHPILASKGMAVTGKILKGVIKTSIKVDFDNDSKDDVTVNSQIPDINLPDYLKNTDKSILIFDDLERCKIDISNLLGYINYFVEHQGLKVIIIANEDELLKHDSDDSTKSYKGIKEKLIGQTFAVSLDFEGALENFITEVNNQDVRKILSDNTDLIQDIYNNAKYENLRNLRQIISDFERIFDVLPEKVKSRSEILQDILKILMAFSIEIRRAAMQPKDISKLQDEYVSVLSKRISSSQTTSSGVNSSEQLTPLQKIIKIYTLLDLHDPFPNAIWWETFFDKGILDIQELEKSLPNSKYFQDENTPNWVRLWHYLNLNDDEFEELVKKVEVEYAKRDFIELGIIRHITGLFLVFSHVELYQKSKKNILEESKLYIDYLRDNNKLDIYTLPYVSTDDIFGGYAGLGYQGKEFGEFQEFCSYVDKARESASLQIMSDAAQDLLTIMQNDVWKFYKMVHISNSSEQEYYYDVPILKYIKSSDFVEKLLLMSFENLRCVFWALKNRYKFDEINEKLFEELIWLKDVKALLSDEAHNRKGKLSGYRLELLIEEYLSKMIEKLEKQST